MKWLGARYFIACFKADIVECLLDDFPRSISLAVDSQWFWVKTVNPVTLNILLSADVDA